MKFTKIAAGILAGTLSALMIAGSAFAADTIKVGCIFPLTGNNADQGVFNVDGCQFAVDYINEHGGIKALDGAQLAPQQRHGSL